MYFSPVNSQKNLPKQPVNFYGANIFAHCAMVRVTAAIVPSSWRKCKTPNRNKNNLNNNYL